MFPAMAAGAALGACVCAVLGLEPWGQLLAWTAVGSLFAHYITREANAQ